MYDQVRQQHYEGLMTKMSVRLRGDTAYQMCEFRLRQVPHLQCIWMTCTHAHVHTCTQMHTCTHVHLHTCIQVPYLVHMDVEPEFLCTLATKFIYRVYSTLERVPCFDLFIVERGVNTASTRHSNVCLASISS